MGREEIKWQSLILVHRVQLKPMIKAHFSVGMVPTGLSVVAIASIHSEKNRLKEVDYDNYNTQTRPHSVTKTNNSLKTD